MNYSNSVSDSYSPVKHAFESPRSGTKSLMTFRLIDRFKTFERTLFFWIFFYIAHARIHEKSVIDLENQKNR